MGEAEVRHVQHPVSHDETRVAVEWRKSFVGDDHASRPVGRYTDDLVAVDLRHVDVPCFVQGDAVQQAVAARDHGRLARRTVRQDGDAQDERVAARRRVQIALIGVQRDDVDPQRKAGIGFRGPVQQRVFRPQGDRSIRRDFPDPGVGQVRQVHVAGVVHRHVVGKTERPAVSARRHGRHLARLGIDAVQPARHVRGVPTRRVPRVADPVVFGAGFVRHVQVVFGIRSHAQHVPFAAPVDGRDPGDVGVPALLVELYDLPGVEQ